MVPAGIRFFRDEVHGRQQLIVLNVCARLVLADRNACHAAEHVFGLRLVGEEVSERVENRYLPSVFRHQNARGLDNVRVAADDEIRAAVGQDLRPGFLIVVWPERVLFTPVGKDDDEIRSFLHPGKIGLDGVKRHKAVDHPSLSRRAAVETVGVVQHRDTDAVFLDHTEPVRVLFRVVNAKRCDVGIVLPPVAAGIENACLALIKAVVRCTGDNGKAGFRQRVRHLRGRAEIGVVRVKRRVAYQNRLLIDAGNVILRNDRRDGRVKRREVISAIRQFC